MRRRLHTAVGESLRRGLGSRCWDRAKDPDPVLRIRPPEPPARAGLAEWLRLADTQRSGSVFPMELRSSHAYKAICVARVSRSADVRTTTRGG